VRGLGHPSGVRLSALLDGELTDWDRAGVLSHLDHCVRCATVLEHEGVVKSSLRSARTADVAPSTAFEHRLLALSPDASRVIPAAAGAPPVRSRSEPARPGPGRPDPTRPVPAGPLAPSVRRRRAAVAGHRRSPTARAWSVRGMSAAGVLTAVGVGVGAAAVLPASALPGGQTARLLVLQIAAAAFGGSPDIAAPLGAPTGALLPGASPILLTSVGTDGRAAGGGGSGAASPGGPSGPGVAGFVVPPVTRTSAPVGSAPGAAGSVGPGPGAQTSLGATTPTQLLPPVSAQSAAPATTAVGTARATSSAAGATSPEPAGPSTPAGTTGLPTTAASPTGSPPSSPPAAPAASGSAPPTSAPGVPSTPASAPSSSDGAGGSPTGEPTASGPPASASGDANTAGTAATDPAPTDRATSGAAAGSTTSEPVAPVASVASAPALPSVPAVPTPRTLLTPSAQPAPSAEPAAATVADTPSPVAVQGPGDGPAADVVQPRSTDAVVSDGADAVVSDGGRATGTARVDGGQAGSATGAAQSAVPLTAVRPRSTGPAPTPSP